MQAIRPNRVKDKLAAGQNVLAIQGLVTSDMIDQIGPTETDAVWIEGEHGAIDFEEIGDQSRACDLWGKTSIVRVNSHDYGLIYRTLDRGAQGIVAPHVNTREQAESIVQSAKFGPIGKRGMYASRQGFGVADYPKIANDYTLVIVLIEDIEAVRNLDEILAVDHIDCFFVAPNDLAQSMGHVGEVGHPEVTATIADTVIRISAAGRVPGVPGQSSTVDAYRQLGARFFLAKAEEWINDGIRSFSQQMNRTT
jgi:4-hydroxy-2-oxoheptanedioate aldolase